MIFGIATIWLSLAGSLFSIFAYYQARQADDDLKTLWINRGRYGYYFMTAMVTLASAFLMYLLLAHRFEVDYVYRYSSRDLGLGFLISAFWAGQEGSFLFWAWLTALMGWWLLKKSNREEASVMVFLNLIQVGFLAILIKASPFALLPEIPADGAGLNPLLQNFWMVIHPPVLFLGYAAAAIPFALALSALWDEDFSHWRQLALPWSLFASVTLGAGIIIGGFWAYEVLGWGGYWGWDPVENSSLIAWLVIIALFHGLLINKRTGALQKTNLSLAILSFVLVLYATFLTRSGVLADFSVHSFQDLGINSYLIVFMTASIVLGFGLLWARKDVIPSAPFAVNGLNKENILLVTLILFLTSATLILIGTSSPILTGIFGNPSQASIDFYNRVNLPLGILMALVLTVAPFLKWKETNLNQLFMRVLPPAVVGIITLGVLLFLGMDSWQYIFFLTFSAMALVANSMVLVHRLRHSKRGDGIAAVLTHIGVVFVFFGIILSAYFSEDQRLVMTQNQPVSVYGASFTYVGDYDSPDGKDGVIIKVLENEKTYEMKPKLYMNNYLQNMMHEPAIKRGIVSDLYLSPLKKSSPDEHRHSEITMSKGQKAEWQGYQIEFKEFAMSNHENASGISVAARLLLSKEDKQIEATPAIIVSGKETKAIPFEFDDEAIGKTTIVLIGLNADSKSIHLIFENEKVHASEQHTAQVLMEISKKRFMSVLWAGTILLIIGTIIGAQTRFKEAVSKA